jgi:hypothetical protein
MGLAHGGTDLHGGGRDGAECNIGDEVPSLAHFTYGGRCGRQVWQSLAAIHHHWASVVLPFG